AVRESTTLSSTPPQAGHRMWSTLSRRWSWSTGVTAGAPGRTAAAPPSRSVEPERHPRHQPGDAAVAGHEAIDRGGVVAALGRDLAGDAPEGVAGAHHHGG